MADLHETVMGRRLIEHTLPEIARQLERIANAMEKPADEKLIRLKEKYKTLSELNPDYSSRHKMNIRIREEMGKVLAEIKNIAP